MLPSNWVTVKVADICAPGKSSLVTGPFGSAIGSRFFCGVGVPVIRGSNLSQDIGIRLVDDGLVFVSAEKAEEFSRSVARRGDLVFTCWGTIDQVGLIDSRSRYKQYIVSNKQMKFTPDSTRADSLFLYYFFSSAETRAKILSEGIGSSVPGFNLGQLKAFEVSLPPLSEQKAIAAILGALDDKIELNRRMNATLENVARALFQSWFVDFDPVRAKMDGRQPLGMDKATATRLPSSFQDSEIGPVPQGWKVGPLYDTARFINGAAFKSDDFCSPGEGLPVVKIAELKDGIGPQTKWSLRLADPEQCIETGDLLYSWSGSPDTSLDAFIWTKGAGLLNQHIFKVVTPTMPEKRFAFYLLKWLRPVLVEIARNKQTTGLGHVTVADLKRLLVCLPPSDILALFDGITAPVFDKTLLNLLEGQSLATLRDTLLPKLLSGELRIKDAERFVSEAT